MKLRSADSLLNDGGPGGRSTAVRGNLGQHPHAQELPRPRLPARHLQRWKWLPSHHIPGNVPGVSVGNGTSPVQPKLQDYTSHPGVKAVSKAD